MIEWEDKFSVGISIIDEQHKKFIEIINKAIVAKEHNDNPEELKELLYRITKHAILHFSTEEVYMIESNYIEYIRHKKEHHDFERKIISYCKKVADGDYQITNEKLEHLKQWVVNHIQGTDKKYVNCFKSNSLKYSSLN